VERLAVIGVSHRRGGADTLSAWHERYLDASSLDPLGLGRGVVLATCNRWEVAVHLPPDVDPAEARRRLAGDGPLPYAYVRDGALERLIRVASGLDSLNPGEDQIMRQVRAAYLASRDDGRTDAVLSYAFERALRAAKRVRREVALAPLSTSLFSLARPELEATLDPGAPVLVLGAGEMGSLAARSLRDLGYEVTIANRTVATGERVAAELGIRVAALADVLADPPAVQALVCATPVRGLVDERLLRRATARVCVDLGIPRNVAAGAGRAAGVRLLDVDSLEEAGARRRSELRDKLAEAERLVLDELDAAVDEWNEKQLGPSIRALRERTLATLQASLPEGEAEKLVGRLVHDPIKGLRAIAREHGVDVARTYLTETGLVE
jgi:glutamyl-tRNA reductase